MNRQQQLLVQDIERATVCAIRAAWATKSIALHFQRWTQQVLAVLCRPIYMEMYMYTFSACVYCHLDFHWYRGHRSIHLIRGSITQIVDFSFIIDFCLKQVVEYFLLAVNVTIIAHCSHCAVGSVMPLPAISRNRRGFSYGPALMTSHWQPNTLAPIYM